MIQFPDITALEVLNAPDAGDQIHERVLADLEAIKAADGTLYSSQYSFTLFDVAQAMNVCWTGNPVGIGLFDGSCYAEQAADQRAVDTATAGVDPSKWAVGSMPGGQIVHDKLFCDPVTGICFAGSYNLSESAAREANNAWFVQSKSMALFFAAAITRNLPVVKAHPYVRKAWSSSAKP